MAFHFEHLNLLILEDTEPMRKLLVSIAQNLGVGKVDALGDGNEAFSLFVERNHDIILTDWLMKPVDGVSFTRKIRKTPQSPNRMVPIILITGYSARSRVQEARDAGVTEFLIKPFTAFDLAKRIGHVVTNPRDFIKTSDFFGPDRRRRDDKDYKGPKRRSDDEQEEYRGLPMLDVDFIDKDD